MGAKNQKMNKKEKEKNIENFTESNIEKSNKFKVLKKIIKKTIEYINIFPNGNILVYNKKKVTIFEPKLFKIIFKYRIKDINNILILSNENILLYKKGKDYFSILNLSKNIKKIKIELKEEMYTYEENNNISFVKLNDNHILFYYKEAINSPSRDYYSYFFTFIFYIYDRKISDLIFDYNDSHILGYDSGNILPYGDYSFFFFWVSRISWFLEN